MKFEVLQQAAYILAAFLFTYGLKMLSSPRSARRGNLVSALAMLIAVAATFVEVVSVKWIAVGMAVGAGLGVYLAFSVVMTEMPQMVALLNGFGGLASLLVGWAEYQPHLHLTAYDAVSIFLAVFIGGNTSLGSVVAWAKLAGRINSKPFLFPLQQWLNLLLLLLCIATGFVYAHYPLHGAAYPAFLACVIFSLVLGATLVIPIGGADMPVVISLHNSYAGLAGCATGFLVQNNVLIVTGALVGASGMIMTYIMCKALNRSLLNILFGGVGAVETKVEGAQGKVRVMSVEDAYLMLEAAHDVVIVPGYGLAVAQAQHALYELGQRLEENGARVRYAVHPVAGRMPGHMNVLLAEANVPYDALVEIDDVNPDMPAVDVCLVVGANDVVNPAAREVKTSPIYGMPIIDADKARMVFVLKRSTGSGFSGVDNPLFFRENARMVLGDAKSTLLALVAQFKDAAGR